jgi:hypothetical protein
MVGDGEAGKTCPILFTAFEALGLNGQRLSRFFAAASPWRCDEAVQGFSAAPSGATLSEM